MREVAEDSNERNTGVVSWAAPCGSTSENTTVYLSDEQTMDIKDRAREIGSSETEVIRSATDQLAGAKPIARKCPRSIGAISRDTVCGRDFDEWLAANWERDW